MKIYIILLALTLFCYDHALSQSVDLDLRDTAYQSNVGQSNVTVNTVFRTDPAITRYNLNLMLTARDTKILGTLGFNTVIFKDVANFGSIELTKECNFQSCIFEKKVTFSNSKFLAPAVPGHYLQGNEPSFLPHRAVPLPDLENEIQVLFEDCYFKEGIDMTLSNVSGTLMFLFDTGKISLGFPFTCHRLYMIGSHSEGNTLLDHHSNRTYLINSTFQSLQLNGSRVKELLYFEKVTVDSLSFDGIVLPETLVFDNVNAKNGIDLTNIMKYDYNDRDTNKMHYLYLKNIDLSKLKLEYDHFRLISKVSRVDTRGLSDAQMNLNYEGLLKNFKENGQTKSYELCDIEYTKFKDKSFLKYQSKFLEWWWNFGYSKEKVFRNAIYLLIFFGFFTSLFVKYLNEKVYKLSDHVEEIPPHNIYNHLGRRIWFSFYYTITIFLLLTLKIENIKLKYSLANFFALLYLLLIHGTGLACLAFIVNFLFSK